MSFFMSKLGGGTMAKRGAKGKYREWLTPEGLTRIKGWAMDGLSNDQIARNMGISKQTFYMWQKQFAEFSDSLKKSKDVADREVENSLYKSAMGFEYIEVKEIIEKGDNGKEKKRIEKTKKLMKPDTTAGIFWLKNRKPKQWRDKQVLDLNHKGVNINVKWGKSK